MWMHFIGSLPRENATQNHDLFVVRSYVGKMRRGKGSVGEA